MKYYACDRCLTIVRVHGDPVEIQRLIVRHTLWREGLPCVNSHCQEKMYELSEVEARAISSVTTPGVVNLLTLTVGEFFRALCGYGLPDEIKAEPEVVKALLLSSKVINASVHTSASGKTLLEKLDLENGTCLHLASSSRGPVVFKVTRRRDGKIDNVSSELQQDSEDGTVRLGDRSEAADCTGGCQCRGTDDNQRHEAACEHGGYHCGSPQATSCAPECCSDDDTRDDETDTVRTETSKRFRTGYSDAGSD